MRYDVVIVGGGPAGLTAAVWLGRCRRKVLLCDTGRPRSARAHGVHGFLTRDGIDPFELRGIGRDEARSYGVEIRDVEVTNATPDAGGYVVDLSLGAPVRCRKLLLASGVRDELPDVDGLDPLYGSSVFHCPYCDAWEVRDRRLAALGRGNRGAGLALTLKRWSDDVHLFTNGAPEHGHALRYSVRRVLAAQGIMVHEQPVLRLEGEDGSLRQVVLADGTSVAREALFCVTRRVQASPLPAKLGCRIDRNGAVLTNRKQEVERPNLFVAGDAAKDVNFAIVAAAEGARAAYAINSILTLEDQHRRSLHGD